MIGLGKEYLRYWMVGAAGNVEDAVDERRKRREEEGRGRGETRCGVDCEVRVPSPRLP